MPNFGFCQVRTALILAFGGNLVAIACIILANVASPDYFRTDVLNIGIWPYSGTTINTIIRYVLAPVYFVVLLWIVFYILCAFCKVKAMDAKGVWARHLTMFFGLLQLAAVCTHTTVISMEIDMYRVNPECMSTALKATGYQTSNIMSPWTTCFDSTTNTMSSDADKHLIAHVPWHLVVLLAILPALLSLICLFWIVERFQWYSKKVQISTRTIQPDACGEVNETLEKTRVVKIVASGPADEDGNIRVLLRERDDGEFEVITEQQFQEIEIEEQPGYHTVCLVNGLPEWFERLVTD